MATIHSTVQMTERELKAWPTLGSLPTCADEENGRSVTIDSLPSYISSDKEDSDDQSDRGTKASVRSGPSSPWRRSATPWAAEVRSASASPVAASPVLTVCAPPGLEDLVDSEVFESALRYDRSLLLQVRLQLCSSADKKDPVSISCEGRSQRRSAAPEVQVETAAPKADEVEERTTVMLRNLPNQCTRAMLAKFLSTTDFEGQFDLVYVPMDRTSGNNLGYSFINFVEADSCQRFIRAMNGTKAARCFPGSRSGKVLQCNYAKVQGKEHYCMGLANAASKLCAMGDALAAMETMAPVPLTNTEAAKEEKAEPATKFQGLRGDAPEFVPGKVNTDALMTAFSAAQNFYCQDTAREEAIARARHYSTKLFVPGQSSSLFIPAAGENTQKENLPATN